MKTNAARILDGLAVAYELRDYEVDPNDLSAEKVAAAIGMPPEQVFKTLVVRGTQIVLAPDDYLRATGAATGPISRLKSQ